MRQQSCRLLLVLASSCSALRQLPPAARPPSAKLAHFDPLGLHAEPQKVPAADAHDSPAVLALGLAALAAAQPEAALAKGGEFGIFEGRIVSLAHPTIMALTYAASAWAAFTGFQWRRLRELGTEITALKAELAGPKQELGAYAASDATAPADMVQRVSALESQIAELSATRKELANGSFRDKHYQVGSVVLGLGTSFAIEGPVNTFMRAQKLFPGPHLYAGAGIVVCWAMAASLVPLMSKGKESARLAHIAFNVFAIGLFTWQLPTGWEITQKVIKFTKFP